MSQTVYGVNDPKTVKLFGGALFTALQTQTFFGKNMMENIYAEGKSAQMANAPMCVVNDLVSQAGDRVSFDVYVQLTGQGTFGDDLIENNLEDLSAYTDEIIINQVRNGVDAGGKMTRKRVMQDLRMTAKQSLDQWMATYFDQAAIATLSGARGINPGSLLPKGNAPIKGGNPYDSYDTSHQLYGGAATSKATITGADKMSLDVIDRAIHRATSKGGGADGVLRLPPLSKDGEDAYIMLISPSQEHDLRKDIGPGGWTDLQKAAAGNEGNKSNLFKQTLGSHRGVHLRRHQDVTQFDDAGAGANLRADRAVFMGRQAIVAAFGSASSKGGRAEWTEETKDMGNRLVFAASMVYGLKLPKFNDKVFASIAIDTAVSSLG